MFKSKFEELKPFLKSKKILITTHALVDIDAFSSCFVFKFLINQKYDIADVSIFFAEISKFTKEFIEKISQKFPDINFSLKTEVNPLDFNIIFILDTNNIHQVKFPDNFDVFHSGIPFIFIDHHLNLKKNYPPDLNPLNIIDDKFSSTTEIIYELSEHLKIPLTVPYKYLLIAAILTDTGFFKYGNNNSIIHVSRMLNSKINLQDILQTLKIKKEIPEKLAQIKALQRVQIIQEGKWLIGLTHVGSFEASVASSLLKIGFDIGIVYSEKKATFRISTRAKKKLCLETDLHLGKILEDISEICEGSGGGHDGAASINGKTELKATLDKIIEKIKQILNN